MNQVGKIVQRCSADAELTNAELTNNEIKQMIQKIALNIEELYGREINHKENVAK